MAAREVSRPQGGTRLTWIRPSRQLPLMGRHPPADPVTLALGNRSWFRCLPYPIQRAFPRPILREAPRAPVPLIALLTHVPMNRQGIGLSIPYPSCLLGPLLPNPLEPPRLALSRLWAGHNAVCQQADVLRVVRFDQLKLRICPAMRSQEMSGSSPKRVSLYRHLKVVKAPKGGAQGSGRLWEPAGAPKGPFREFPSMSVMQQAGARKRPVPRAPCPLSAGPLPLQKRPE